MNGQQIVSEAWIDEVTSWGPDDQQVRLGTPAPEGSSELCNLTDVGYKCYMWHLKVCSTETSAAMFRCLLTMRVELIGHFRPCMTDIYLHI